MKDQKPIQKNHLPEFQNIELEIALDKKLKKNIIKQREKEKHGKFYVLEGFLPITKVFVPKGKNVKKYLANYAKKLDIKVTSLRKVKL